MDGSPNCRNKTTFSNVSGEVRTATKQNQSATIVSSTTKFHSLDGRGLFSLNDNDKPLNSQKE